MDSSSWEDVFMENCGPEKLAFLAMCSAGFLVPLSFLFFVATYSFFRRRRIFHPLFSFCFLVLLLFYLFSSTLLAVRNIFFAVFDLNFDGKHSLTDLIIINCEKIYMALLFYIPPIISIAIIERVFATAFSRSYERDRPWSVLVFALLIVSVLVYIEFANRHVLQATIPSRNIQVLFAVLCSWSLFILLVANRSKSKAGRARSALSERYQVTENIKALRILIPVVCLDTIIQIMFLCTDIFLNVGQVLNLNFCYDDDLYLKKFLVFRMIGFLIQYFIPIIVILHFSFLSCNTIRRRPVKRSTPISPSPETNPFSVVTIRNVFGMTVSGDDYGQQGQDAHFRNLYSQWN